MLREFNEVCRIAKLPLHEQAAAWEQFHLDMVELKAKAEREFRWLHAVLFFPNVRKVATRLQSDYALLACTEVAIAAERFRIVNNRWPKTLDELCPDFLTSIPLDPFDGKALRYAHRENGVAIYAIGDDGEDNGGKQLSSNPSLEEPRDVGIRLWDPKHRRLPPVPLPGSNSGP
jgi:hypothetical protein